MKSMIIDKQALFSDDQEITTSCISDNVYDCGPDEGMIQELVDSGIIIALIVTTAFVGGLELYISLQTDDDENFLTTETLFYTRELIIDQLTTGKMFRVDYLPIGISRYLRLYYHVNGTMTAGAISASLVVDKQSFPGSLYELIFLATEDDEKIVDGDGTFIILGGR